MRVAAAHPFEIDAPARTTEARDAEILARARHNPPARHRGASLDRRTDFRRAAEKKGRNAGRLGGELEPFRRGNGIFGDFANNPRNAGVSHAFLHGEQDIGIAARLDMDQPAGMKARKMQGGGEEIAPAKAPKNGALSPGEDAREEDRRAGVVCKFGTARDLMECPGRQPAARQPRVDGIEFERDNGMTCGNTFDLRNFRAKIGKDGGLAHDIIRPGGDISFPLCSVPAFRVKRQMIRLRRDEWRQ